MSHSFDEKPEEEAKPIVEADREAPAGKCPFHEGKSNKASGGGTTSRDCGLISFGSTC